jgi:autotransporter-associated beta strand protein
VLSGGHGFTKTGAGTLTLSGVNTYSGPTAINAGQVHLTGSAASSAFTINSGGTLSGTGTLGALTVASGGTLSPGASPGTLAAGATTFAGGGGYRWEINNATGAAGTNWDLLSVSGALTITATSGNPFTLSLVSLTPGNDAGTLINFNAAQNSSYTIATASGGIVGFDAGDISINTGSFTNTVNGTWSLSAIGNNLNLVYTTTAIPEPSTYAALAGVLMLAFAAHRRRNREKQ